MSAAEKFDFESIALRLHNARTGTRERRRFRRTSLVIGGRMLDPLGREQDCRTADISPGDVRITAPVLPGIGERVVLYLDGLGRVSGKVARRCGEDEVAVIFDFSAHKREKLAEQLMLTMNAHLGVAAEPRSMATVETGQMARIELESGESYQGEVLDFSLAGITLKTTKPAPLIGAWVRIGGVYGRVARLIDGGGFAVDFEPRGQRP
jgi:hypothetical protein